MFTLMISDDCAQERESLHKMIAEAFPEITRLDGCGSGTETLRAVIQVRPDVLFIDTSARQGSGFDTVKQLQTIGFGGGIIFTARDRSLADADRAFLLGAAGYIQKPVSSHILNATLSPVIQKARLDKESEHTESSAPAPILSKDCVPLPVRKACLCIQGKFSGHLPLENIAAASGISKFHLCREFRSHMGITIHQYLSKMRIRHARDMLCRSVSSIAQIAEEAGYTDVCYFTAAFTKEVGISPAAYRRYFTNLPVDKQEFKRNSNMLY